jgi:prepilin-type processing-associated H-X9-DG protein
LLPYLEERNAYDHLDRRVSVYDPANAPVRRLHLRILACPSQFRRGRGYSDYAGVHHDIEAPIDTDNNGVFFLNSRLTYFDVRDGTSQTLFIGEKLTFAGDLGWMSGTRATLRNTGVALSSRAPLPSTPRGWPPGTAAEEGQPVDVVPADMFILESLFEGNSLGRPRRQGGDYSFQSVPIPVDATIAVGGFGSFHAGGANFALGDGSVRYLSGSMNPKLYWQMGHRRDNQLPSSEDSPR